MSSSLRRFVAASTIRGVWIVLIISALSIVGPAFGADDTVTIPKSRLKELEAKEAELKKLKGEFNEEKKEKDQLQKKYDEAAAKAAAATAAAAAANVPVHVSPPLASLPPFDPGQTVNSMDLANYYKLDAKAADERFRKKKFRVQGEIVGFEKPLFVRYYRILLNSPDPKLRVACEVYPPDKYSAVFPVKNGTEFVGVIGETRVPLLKVGDKVTLEGECRGERDGAVNFSLCQFR